MTTTRLRRAFCVYPTAGLIRNCRCRNGARGSVRNREQRRPSMVRLDDNELNINPEVAAALGYPRQGNARGRRNARAEAQPRYAHGQGNGFGLFGAFGVALLLLLIICTVSGIT